MHDTTALLLGVLSALVDDPDLLAACYGIDLRAPIEVPLDQFSAHSPLDLAIEMWAAAGCPDVQVGVEKV